MGCVPSMRITSGTANSPNDEEDEKERGVATSPSNGVHADCIISVNAATAAVAVDDDVKEGHRSGSVTCNSILVSSITTGELLRGVDKVTVFDGHGSQDSNTKQGKVSEAPVKIGSCCREVYFGPMHIQQQTMSVLLVFPKKGDKQCEAFVRAATEGNYVYDVVHTAESALQTYFERHHHVIYIDARFSKKFDAIELCTHIRATHNSDHTVLVAVRVVGSCDPPMLSLLKAGFNRQFTENVSATMCLDELQSLEYSEVLAQSKLKVAQAFLTAVENSSDAVEIMSESHEIQYVNSTFEKLFGYLGKDVIGKRFGDLSKIDKMKPDVIESINTRTQNGKHWDGVCHVRRQNGETLSQKCRVFPVLGQSGKVRHLVAIRSLAVDGQAVVEQTLANSASSPVGGDPGVRRVRKESVAKLPPMTMEAPITKVINMIAALQETSPLCVVESLDKVLEALRSSELYAPYFTKQVRDDKMTSELVGGLMTVDEELLYHRKMSIAKRTSCSSDKPLLSKQQSHMPVIRTNSPEVQALLDNEEKWDFDIIQLERLTNNRPLVHLAMQTFQRFDVLEFLKVDESVLLSWLHTIESNYHASNPYHNSTHAADVMHATAYFLSCDRIKNIFDECDQVASLIAAVIHDLDHPGKTNSFLVHSNADLAVLYNDLAVLESHHVSSAYRITLKDPNINIFKNLPRDDYRSLRQQVVDMVLATEMTKHFEHLNRFVSVINQSQDGDTDTGFDPVNSDSSDRLSTIENQTLVKRMMIKCADVSNPARPLQLCIEWARRIAEEYCQQTDAEKAQNLPVVMPAFDSKSCNIPRTQITFIDFFINDMFDAWTNFCGLPNMSQTLKENYQYWKRQEDIVAKELSEKTLLNGTD